MNFWHMQMHQSNSPLGIEKDILIHRGVIGLASWDTEEAGQQEAFKNKMKKGDIVAIKKGATPIALVEVDGPYFEKNDDIPYDWLVRRREVKILDWYRPELGLKLSSRGTLIRCDQDGDAESTKSILKWFNLIQSGKMKTEAIDLLKYKKQIILQGPPGTGKTRLAKEIAKELTAPKDLGSPTQKIEEFFKTFNSRKDEYLEIRKEKDKLLSDFQELFPKENLKDLTLESYCIGTGERDNFCWWIERGLKSLGYYFPGSSRSYLIYWNKATGEYSTHYNHSKVLREFIDPKEGMKKLAEVLHGFVNNPSTYDLNSLPFGWSFIIKVLHSYYPEKYFPTNGHKYMVNILNLLGIKSQGKNTYELNLMLQQYFDEKSKEYNCDMRNYEFVNFLRGEFDLHGEIEMISEKVVSKGEFKLIQFHPAYTYEDFVRGIVVETNDGPHPDYKVVDKVLAEFSSKALANKSSNYVLIIDEINRANLPSVLGELIYALEYRFDPEKPEETSVESMYSLRDEGDSEVSEGRILRLPKNLFIIGTMNTADRSVGHIDYAIRRRFAFVDVQPRLDPVHDSAKGYFKEVSSLFVKNYKEVLESEQAPERSDCLSPDFRPEDVWIGHSYFLTDKTGEEAKLEIDIKMKYEVVPLLKEYLKDGILIDEAKVKEVIHTISQ
ncbi:AAA family ATPase [Cyclobacteriaceae bacterium YHN15]|nr:AAA family ATPase [Cyclobacteriaceae bacterium YHN15]